MPLSYQEIRVSSIQTAPVEKEFNVNLSLSPEKPYLFVSHGQLQGGKSDFDSIGSVASMVRAAVRAGLAPEEDFSFTLINYYDHGLDQLLQYSNRRILIADIPPEALLDRDSETPSAHLEATLKTLQERENKVDFIDHHSLSDNTRRTFDQFQKSGLISSLLLSPYSPEQDARVSRDQKQCATEMVQDYLFSSCGIPDDDIFRDLRRFARDQDLGIREIPEATRISIIIGSEFDNRILINWLSEGTFWNDTLESRLQETEESIRTLCEQIVIREVKIKWRDRDAVIAFALNPGAKGLKSTAAALYVFEKTGADLVINIYRQGFVSLRRRQGVEDINAAEIARALGGGGHVGAAAAGARNGNKRFPFPTIDKSNLDEVVSFILDRLNDLKDNHSR